MLEKAWNEISGIKQKMAFHKITFGHKTPKNQLYFQLMSTRVSYNYPNFSKQYSGHHMLRTTYYVLVEIYEKPIATDGF